VNQFTSDAFDEEKLDYESLLELVHLVLFNLVFQILRLSERECGIAPHCLDGLLHCSGPGVPFAGGFSQR
jgi:hypothetical protein